MTAGTWDDPDLRVYFDPTDIDPRDGYPYRWHAGDREFGNTRTRTGIKHLIRQLNGHRCERCKHPFPLGSPGEWSPCDDHCAHVGPFALVEPQLAGEGVPLALERAPGATQDEMRSAAKRYGLVVTAQWRILTVHHLNGVKHDLRWWNLAALCQRCHLLIQGKVRMERPYLRAHSEWFKPHAAGWYAWDKLGQDISRAEALDRLDELLALEHLQGELL